MIRWLLALALATVLLGACVGMASMCLDAVTPEAR